MAEDPHMTYCKNCNKTFHENNTFCQDCGKKLTNAVKTTSDSTQQSTKITKKLKQNWKILLAAGAIIVFLIILICIAAVGLFFIVSPKEQPLIPVNSVFQKEACPYECCFEGSDYQLRVCQGNFECINNTCEQKQCPFECCDGTGYAVKSCDTDYECVSHICKPQDSDGDGLTNLEEKELGTNPNLADSDGDTLNDYREARVLLTDPLNPNTDGDRYADNVDLSPLEKNTAKISITKTNEKGNYDYFNIGVVVTVIGGSGTLACLFTGCTLTVPVIVAALGALGVAQTVIYYDNMDVVISNEGTDYSSYVNYEINYYVGDELALSKMESIGRIDVGKTVSEPYAYEIKAIDVPGALIRILTKKPVLVKKIENIQYETF